MIAPKPHEPRAWRMHGGRGFWLDPSMFIAGLRMATEWQLHNGQIVIVRPRRTT